MAYTFLILYWLLSFSRLFAAPYSYATGEHLENYFSYWRYTGEQIRKLKGWFRDDLYYYEPGAIPFLSAWYLPHIISSFCGSFLSLNHSFILYTGQLLLHYLFASFFAYNLFLLLGYTPVLSFMCATALTYATRFLNLNGALAYTPCWLAFTLWAIASGMPIVAGLGFFMMFSAGYTTMFLYFMPVIGFFALSMGTEAIITFIATSSVLIAPQALYTASYYKKTVRKETTYEQRAIGSVHPFGVLGLFIPININYNSVLFVEYTFRVGRVVAIAALLSRNGFLWGCAIICVYLMLGKYVRAPVFLRIPAKWSYVLSIVIVFMAADFLSGVSSSHLGVLCFLQCLDTIYTHPSIMFIWPFTEYPVPPNKAFSSKLATYKFGGRVSGLPWPLRAGYVNGIKTLGYKGGSCLASVAKFFNFDSNGSPYHDWFLLKDSEEGIEEYDVRFAYTRFQVSDKWKRTSIRHLYERRS